MRGAGGSAGAGLVAGEWEFRGRVAETDPPPSGFRIDSAQAATRLSGYYVFHAWRQERPPDGNVTFRSGLPR